MLLSPYVSYSFSSTTLAFLYVVLRCVVIFPVPTASISEVPRVWHRSRSGDLVRRSLLCAPSLLEHTYVTVMTDGMALHPFAAVIWTWSASICRSNLDMERKTYTTLNRWLAQIISSLTAPVLFDGHRALDLGDTVLRAHSLLVHTDATDDA